MRVDNAAANLLIPWNYMLDVVFCLQGSLQRPYRVRRHLCLHLDAQQTHPHLEEEDQAFWGAFWTGETLQGLRKTDQLDFPKSWLERKYCASKCEAWLGFLLTNKLRAMEGIVSSCYVVKANHRHICASHPLLVHCENYSLLLVFCSVVVFQPAHNDKTAHPEVAKLMKELIKSCKQLKGQLHNHKHTWVDDCSGGRINQA